MKCPICKKVEVTLADPEFPFCSERCRIIDLGNWASGQYAIPIPGPLVDDFEHEHRDDEEE